MNTKEIPFPYDRYLISDCGKLIVKKTGLIVKCSSGGTSPYKVAVLSYAGKKKAFLLHRLVAMMFVPNSDPDIKTQVNHIDGNKLNNAASNLEWVSPKENMAHALSTGLYRKYNNQTYKGKFGKDHNRSMVIQCLHKDQSVPVICYGLREAAEATGEKMSTISMAIKQNRITRAGYIYKIIQ